MGGGAIGNTAPVKQEIGEIKELAEKVFSRLQGLDSTIERLQSKIGPVLQDDPINVLSEEPKTKCEVGNMLFNFANRIGIVQQQLDNLIIRCQL